MKTPRRASFCKKETIGGCGTFCWSRRRSSRTTSMLLQNEIQESWLTGVVFLRTSESTTLFVRNFAQRFPKSRNAHLALLEVSSWSLNSEETARVDFFTALINFYDLHSTKLYCFDDIRRYVSHLSQAHTLELVDHALEQVTVQPNVRYFLIRIGSVLDGWLSLDITNWTANHYYQCL